MKVLPGVLYGVGVGPGDPDLLTVKAIKVLSRLDVVLAASSSKNDYSTALSIASAHVPETAEVRALPFPMTRDSAELEAAWAANARIALDCLAAGQRVACITLGDPSLFSTFGYLSREVRALDPSIEVRSVPGITSFQAAASLTGRMLAASGQGLTILSGIESEAHLTAELARGTGAAILKCYRNMPAIKRALTGAGREDDAVFVTRLGMEGERVVRDFADFPDTPHYFSLILVQSGGGA